MAKFSVPIVKKEFLPLWHDFWNRQSPRSAAVDANQDGSLARTIVIEAENHMEAAAIAEKQHPEHVAIRTAVETLD